MKNIEEFLRHFSKVKKTGSAEYQALCPAHDDQVASLSITANREGIALHCHAGCTAEAVVNAVGLTMSDLFFDNAKPDKKRIVATYDYTDADGKLLFQSVRYSPKGFSQRQPDGNGGWFWNLKGVKRVLYHLPKVLESDVVYLVEGEKDCDRLASLDLTATTCSGGANKWRVSYNESLRDRDVFIIPDNDEPGHKHAQDVSEALQGTARSIRVVNLPGLDKGGDVSDWLQAGHNKNDLLTLVEAAKEPWQCTTTSFADLDTVIGPIKWAWQGWLPIGFLTLLAGQSGRGKSALALRIAGTFLKGDPWPDGNPYEGETGKVLWCEAEAAQALNLARAKAWGLPLDHLVLPFSDPMSDVMLDDPVIFAQIAAVARDPEVRLIIVDSLSGAHQQDENSTDILRIVKHLAELARDVGLPILLTHHLRKKSNFEGDEVTLDRLRGSSTIVQPARVVWSLDSPNASQLDWARLSIIKNNLARFADPLGMKIDDSGVTFGEAPQRPHMESQTDKAADLLLALLRKRPMTSSELQDQADGVGISWATFKRAKKQLSIVSVLKDGRWLWSLPADEAPF